MKKDKAVLIFAFLLTSAIAVSLLHVFTGRFTTYPRYKAFVERVIDGDTLLTREGENIRLLGINAPEKGQYFYEEAKQALQLLVENKTVELEIDVTNRDKYGRSLRYLFVDNTFVNLWMIENGYAHTYRDSSNTRYKQKLDAVEENAKERQVGIWKLSNFSKCFFISDFKFKGSEHITFQSTCGYINISGWYVEDEANTVYRFPTMEVERITLHTGYGDDNSTDLFWNHISVWNDEGDTVFLRDDYSLLVLSYTY